MEHVDIPPGEIHKPHNFEYANSTARLVATGFAAGDVGKLALQLSDLTYWILSATTPTWASLAATGPQGIQGETGPAGTTTWAGITDKPADFTPSAHNHDASYYTESEIDSALAGKAALATAQTFSGAQRGAVTALTSTAASVAIDLAVNNNFSHTTSENTTLAAPSNPVAGQSGVITITQGATARLLAYNAFWKFPGGTIPALTATVGAVDVLAYSVESATRATCQLIKDVK